MEFEIKLRPLLLLPACLALAACPAPRPAPEAAPAAVQAPPVSPPGRRGRPFEVSRGDSLITILAFRGGTLARAGHNHVIACRTLSGTVYVPADPLQSSFELRIPVAELTVDEPQLRAAQASAEFPPDLPEAARSGTRANMLGEALLDAAGHPDIVLRSIGLEPAGAPGAVRIRAEVLLRGVRSVVVTAARYELGADRLSVSGELAVRQTELGLTPFSALLGALQVQDALQLRFTIVARPAPTDPASRA